MNIQFLSGDSSDMAIFFRMLPIRLVQLCLLGLALSRYVLYFGIYSMKSEALERSRTQSPSLRALYLSILHIALDLRWISQLLQ